jgi:hypothetical protein
LEEPDAAMAWFRGGLNREIQDILGICWHDPIVWVCLRSWTRSAGTRSRTYSNTFAGRNSSSSSALPLPAPSTPTPRERTTTSVGAAPATGTTSTTRDITCFRYSRRGHVARDYPNKCTLLIHGDGEYSSASDSKELEHTLLATDNAAKTDIHVNLGDADRYESLVIQRVLSTQCWREIRTLRQAHSKPNKLASHASRFQSVSVNFPWKLTKDKVVKYQSLELAGWY